MARENWKSQKLVRECWARGSGCSSRRHPAEGRGWLLSGELTVIRHEVKIYSWAPAAKMWGDESLWAPILVHSKGDLQLDATQWTSMLEIQKKAMKKSKACVWSLFLTWICFFSLSSSHGRLSFHTLFFSPSDYQLVVVMNKPLGS